MCLKIKQKFVLSNRQNLIFLDSNSLYLEVPKEVVYMYREVRIIIKIKYAHLLVKKSKDCVVLNKI